MSAPIVVLSAVRTPWGRMLGSLSDVSAVGLGFAASAEALRRSGLEASDVDRVFLGNVLAHGCGGSPAGAACEGLRLEAASMPLTVRAGCASGLAAISLAVEAISGGLARTALAGGFESASQSPHLAIGLRRGLRLGAGTLLDAARLDGPVGVLLEVPTGSLRTEHAEEALPGEILALELPPHSGGARKRLEHDEHPFPPGGTVEAQKLPLADGAAALVLASEPWARSRGLEPLCSVSVERDPLAAASTFSIIVTDLPADALEALRRASGSALDRQQPRDGPEPIPAHAAGADGTRLIVSLVHAVRREGGVGLALAGAAAGRILGLRVEP